MLRGARRHRVGFVGAAVGVISSCVALGFWASPAASASVRASPLDTTATFTSARVGTSGTTARFSESGPWQMGWTASL
jgi:hypothetical protein